VTCVILQCFEMTQDQSNYSVGGISFDRAGIDRLLSMFSRALAIRVTFFDADDTELAEFDIADRSRYCTKLRQNADMDGRCVACDQSALGIARRRRKPYRYRCHRDLFETVVPLSDQAGHYLGALLCGQIRPTDSRQRHNDPVLRRAYRELTRMDQAQFDRVVELLLFIGEEIIGQGLIRQRSADWPTRLVTFVDQHLAEPLPLARLAAAIARSPSWLSQRFPEQFGESPGRWVIGRRLRQAKELLRQGLSVQATASTLGYCDPFHFSKAYHQHFGHTPSSDRRPSPDLPP
jgi:AraC-like DNA-binding protein/ligand-binding sensor protein